MIDDGEQTIINRVKQGNPNEFEILIKKYEQHVFTIVGNLLTGSHRVEDIVQETFLAAYQHIDTYDSNLGLFSTWLFRIARNKCFNEQKKKKERLVEQVPDIPSTQNPDNDLILKEVFQKLDMALDQLSFTERSAFVLSEFEDLSYSEIAAIEDIPIGTVKSRLSRAKACLRSVLQKYMGKKNG